MIGLTWVLSIVGVLGIGGAIAAAIIAPAVVIPLLQRTIEWILGCKRCLYALAFVVAVFAAFWSGHYKAQLDCNSANVAAALRNQQLDLDIAHRAAEAESTLIKSIEDKASDRQKKDDDYVAKLEARPVCQLDDADVSGLSNHQSGTGDKKLTQRAK
jgi:hypothetical protein